jgi:membrane protein
VTPAEARTTPRPWFRSATFYRGVLAGLWRGLARDDCAGMAAAVAYHFIFSFFAGFFFLACLATQFGQSHNNLVWILDVLSNFLPPQGIQLARDNIDRFMRPVAREALPLALVLSLWTASNVVEMVMKALNRIYSIAETRPAWLTRLGSLAIVLMVALFFLLAFNMQVFGDEIRRVIQANLDPHNFMARFIGSIRWPMIMLASTVAPLVIYFLAPNFRRGRRRVTWPGALFFALAWHFLNYFFNIFMDHFADFDRVYGPLGTAMAVLTWVYMSALLLLVGGELNAQLARQLPRPRPREASGDTVAATG